MGQPLKHPTPQVFVTCLAAYNNGTLHGEWVEATDEDELRESVKRVLASSPEPDAEEFFWSDTDNLPDQIGEYTSIKTTTAVGALVEEHGLFMVQFVADYASDIEDADNLARLLDEVITYSDGERWTSEGHLIAAWAEEYFAELDCDIPEGVIVDWEATGRDMLMGYHLEEVDGTLYMLPPGA